MNGHARRAERKKDNVKRAALELFNKYGVNKVSMNEIALHANVSKVTIYKYFYSKEDLYKEVIKMIFTDIYDSVEETVNSSLSFIEKLKFIIFSKTSSKKPVQGKFIKEIITNNHEIREFVNTSYENDIKQLMFKFFDEGKQEGYIDKSIANEHLYLYIEIFKSGINSNSAKIMDTYHANNAFEQLINLFFFGLINKQPK